MSTWCIRKLNLKTAARDTVPYRNTVLEALYPNLKIGILQVDTDPAQSAVMEKLLAQDYKGCQLDFATGSKKKGQFMVTDSKVARRFWNSPEAAMAYGSSLMTNCIEEPQVIPMRVMVVEDGQWQTGDCHARLETRYAESMLDNQGRALQFRLVSGPYLAKGVAVTSGVKTAVTEPTLPADLIIPLSAFKSAEKPEPGLYDWKVVTWGTVMRSKARKCKTSYQFFQWFSSAAIIQDVMPYVVKRCKVLNEAGKSPKAAVEVLKLDAVEAEYTMLSTIQADKLDQLRSHPWIVKGLTTMLRRRWMDLALGGGLQADSFMGCPDESLDDDQFICNELAPGKYIAFRYPIRSWADIRIWENVGRRASPHGVVWMNEATAAQVAGDFDGDYYNFLSASEFPVLATEVEQWHVERKPPEMSKAGKRRASQWTRAPQVAMDQLNNPLGLVSYLIAKAMGQGRRDIADKLAPQSQIAVDRFKFAVKQDNALITSCGRSLKQKIGWLDNRNDPMAFITHPLAMSFRDGGPIALMVRYVGQQWEPPKLRMRPLKFYVPVFGQCPELAVQARQEYRNWAGLIAKAIERNDDTISQVINAMAEWATNLNDQDAWATEFWRAAHSSKSKLSTGSLPFHAFPNQVADRLQGPMQPAEVLTVVGLKYHEWADQLEHLPPQAIVTVQETTLQDKIRSLVTVAGRTLGIVSAETPVGPGIYERRLLWNGGGSVFAS